MPIDLTSLPAPTAIEALDFEAVLIALMADVNARFTTAGIDYDVGNLETDPVKIILEAAAYRETLLRARVNDAFKSALVAFAAGSNLDHLGAFYDAVRLVGESDDRFRSRIVLAIQGRSPAGPEERYAFVAMSSDIRVREVEVYRVEGTPAVRIAVLATDNGGVPDAPLLAAVTAAVTAPDVRVVSDVIEVVAATQSVTNIAAQIWLLPGAPDAVFTGLEAKLRSDFTLEGGIGFDLNPSWVTSRLHVAGVSRVNVTSPAAPVVLADNVATSIGTVTLTFMGRSR